jgi:hypothetical protein
VLFTSEQSRDPSNIFLKEQLILILSRLKRLVGTSVKVLCARCVHWTKPLTSSLPLGTLADLGGSKSELVAENALLREQLQFQANILSHARLLIMALARRSCYSCYPIHTATTNCTPRQFCHMIQATRLLFYITTSGKAQT